MPNYFDQFDGVEDRISAAPEPGLIDRFKLNFEAGNRTNTILGATYDASTPSRQADRARFDRNYEAYPEWQGFLEGSTALAGQIAGTAASIENFTPIGLGEKILVGSKMAVTGLWAKVFSGAVDAAAVNAVTDAAIQGIDIAGGNAEAFDPKRYAVSVLLGAGIGGAAGGITHGVGKKIEQSRAAKNAEAEKGANFFDALDDDTPSPIADTSDVAAQITPTPDPAAPIIEVRTSPANVPAAELVPSQKASPSSPVTPEYIVNDGALNGLPAGELHGQRVKLSPNQENVPENMRRVIDTNGDERIIGGGLLKPVDQAEKMGAVTISEPARVATPDAPSTIGERLSDQAAEARNVSKFGPAHSPDTFKGDWKSAVKQLSSDQTGEIPGMIEHPEIGAIDVVWGHYNPDTEKGQGLAKIMGKHPEVVDDLPNVIQSMQIKSRSENRIILESADHKGVVRLDYDGETKTWLMTAFEKGRRSQETTHRTGIVEDGTNSSPAPTKQNISLKSENRNLEIGDGDLAAIIGENRLMKAKALQTANASKNVTDFMMATPSAGLRAQRTRTTEAAAQVQSAATHVQRIRETADALATALNITATRQGRITGGKRVLGTFDTRDSVVRVRSLEDFDTLTHEYGHHIDAHIPEIKNFIQQHSKQLSVLDYDPTAGRDYEGFAEFFRLWITNREYLKKSLPDLADKFGKLLDEKAPEMAKAINNAKDAWDTFLTAPSTVAVRSTIVSSKKDGWFKSSKKSFQTNGAWQAAKDFGGTIADVLQRMYTFALDDLNPINRAVSHLKDLHLSNTGKVLDINTSSDPYKLARMSRGAYSAGHMDVMYGVAPYRGLNPESPSLRDAIIEATGKPNSLSAWDEDRITDFGSYLWSRRALGEWERYRNGEIPNPPDKLTRADHTTNVAELEKQFPSFVSAAAKVHEFNRALWKKKYDAGLIDLETFERGNLIKDYVPGLRDFSADSEVKASGKKNGRGGSMKGGLVKRFKGSKRDVINPLESLAADAYETSMTIARNDVVKALHRLALNAGPGGGSIAEIVPAKELRANMVDPIEAIQSAAKNAGLNEADITVLRDAVESAVGSEKAAVFRPAMINEKGEPIVFFRDGGDLKALRLADGKFGHEMYRSLTMMNRNEKNLWLNMLAVPARLLRAGITLTPEFIAANFIRDQTMAAIYYGRPFHRIGVTMRGAADDIIGSDVAKSYSRLYGISGGAETASLAKLMAERDIDGLRRRGWVANRLTSVRGVMQTAEISETATRVGLFRTFQDEAKKRGLDNYEALLEASWRARDYIDFDRRGSGMGAVARVIPLLNATIQGTDKMARHMIMPLAKKFLGQTLDAEDIRALPDAWKAWARLSALTVASMSLYALSSRHEDHDEISETTRATHWMIKSGDKWIAVPKPFEMSAMINLGEAVYDMWGQKDPRAMNRWGDSLYEVLVPPNLLESNPLIKSYFELKSNTNFFTGSPIVPDDLKGMEPFLQYTSRSSAISKQFGKIFNEPPVIIDHLITTHLGSWGRNALSMFDLVQPDAPGFAWDDAPISRRFIKDAARGAQSSTMFWKMAGQREGTLEGKVKSWQAMVESGDEAGAADYYAKLDKISKAYVAVSSLDADAKRLHPMIRARNAIQAIGMVRREMSAGKLLDHEGEPIHVSPAERTAADDILSSLSMALARNGLKEAGVEGWAQRQSMSEDGFYRELFAVNPGIAERLGDAYANKKVWTAEATNAVWAEVKDRVLADGSSAFVGDLVAEVKGGGLALEGMKRPRKKKPVLLP